MIVAPLDEDTQTCIEKSLCGQLKRERLHELIEKFLNREEMLPEALIIIILVILFIFIQLDSILTLFNLYSSIIKIVIVMYYH
jgi:hypothetical protein